jgi:hypothetical protein
MTQVHLNLDVAKNQCSPGKRIATLERLLGMLDKCEVELKQRMQDRMKFMSGKNAFRSDAQLTEIEKTRELIKNELRELQERS